MIFDVLVLLAGILAGAVAAVSIPHVLGTAVRFPERVFRPEVSILITVLGIYMLVHR